jgi:hypothetical protein
MPRMRTLLEFDPSIPIETRLAIAHEDLDARVALMSLGLDECEAAELLDQRIDATWACA